MLDKEKALVARLGRDIADGHEPFAEISQELGIPQEELLTRIEKWKSEGVIRRFGAIVRHYTAGYEGNAMVVWEVPEKRLEEVGEKAASFPQVSHCYERPPRKGWPYNLYTMIHARISTAAEMAKRHSTSVIGSHFTYHHLPSETEPPFSTFLR